REGRPTTREVLTARLIDRPLRPLFPKGFMDEVQVHLNALAFDQDNDPDVMAGIAASAAIAISDIPFITPTAHVRVGRIDGKLILNPTFKELESSELDLVVAGTKHFVNMIEVGSREVAEDVVADAIEFGHKAIVQIVGAIEELVSKCGQPKTGNVTAPDPALVAKVRELSQGRIREVKGKAGKEDRSDAIKLVMEEVV